MAVNQLHSEFNRLEMSIDRMFNEFQVRFLTDAKILLEKAFGKSIDFPIVDPQSGEGSDDSPLVPDDDESKDQVSPTGILAIEEVSNCLLEPLSIQCVVLNLPIMDREVGSNEVKVFDEIPVYNIAIKDGQKDLLESFSIMSINLVKGVESVESIMEDMSINLTRDLLKPPPEQSIMLDSCIVATEQVDQKVNYFIKEQDYIEVHGNRFWKAFVEKYIDGDYNSIMGYYDVIDEPIVESMIFYIESILCLPQYYLVESTSTISKRSAVGYHGIKDSGNKFNVILQHSKCNTSAEQTLKNYGLSLVDVASKAQRASKMVETMGVTLFVCTLPGQVTSDRSGPGKRKLGLGIHGEVKDPYKFRLLVMGNNNVVVHGQCPEVINNIGYYGVILFVLMVSYLPFEHHKLVSCMFLDDTYGFKKLHEIVKNMKVFVRFFEEVTRNEFEPWANEKKFKKEPLKLYPIDMENGVDMRCGRIGLREISVAASHYKLEPEAANVMKVRCNQDIYKNVLKGLLPKNIHWNKCEEGLLEYVENMRSMREFGPKTEMVWSDLSQTWYTKLLSYRDYQEHFSKKKLEQQNIVEKGSLAVNHYDAVEFASDLKGIINLVGSYYHLCYFHPSPISSVLLERHDLQGTNILDGQRLVLLASVKIPYGKEGKKDDIYSIYFSGYSESNAVKIYYTCPLAVEKIRRL